jgi:outer membrane biosynthesis protein TonB
MRTPAAFRLIRIAALAAGLALPLAACETFDLTNLIPDTKKKLPGERRDVFPEGVPGVSKGVPPELMKGYQAPPEETATAPEPKPEPKQAAKPKPKPRAPKPTPSVAPEYQQQGQQGQPRQQQGQWPQQQQQQPAQQSAWPSAPQPGTFQR